MSIKKKALQAAAGNVGAAESTPIEDVFSTYLYDGNNTDLHTIKNGINLGSNSATITEAYHLATLGMNDRSVFRRDLINVNDDLSVETTDVPYTGAYAIDFTGAVNDNSALVVQDEIFEGYTSTDTWTIEAWAKLTTVPNVDALFSLNNRDDGGNVLVLLFGYSSGVAILDTVNGATDLWPSTPGTGTWVHWALSFDGSNLRFFKDGTLETTVTSFSPRAFDNTYFFIGNESDSSPRFGSGNRFPGYIADVRVSKFARYTASFTRPTSPPDVDAMTTSLTDTGEAGRGGMVWIKGRTSTDDHYIADSERGFAQRLEANNTDSAITNANGSWSLNTDGFTLPDFGQVNGNNDKFASYTFAKAERFFDVVTYTGDAQDGRVINHNLNCEVGAIFIKSISHLSNWVVWHRALAQSGTSSEFMYLNTNAGISSDTHIFEGFSSSSFTIGGNGGGGGDPYTHINAIGRTYVAYIFAHDPLGPSGDGSDGLISCGSFTTTGGAGGTQVDLGWEPQWTLSRITNSTGNWVINDNMRASFIDVTAENDFFYADTNNADNQSSYLPHFNSQGFNYRWINSGGEVMYIAIRNGPMKPPSETTAASELFEVIESSEPTTEIMTSGYGVRADMVMHKPRKDTAATGPLICTRLMGDGFFLNTASTSGQVDARGVIGDGYWHFDNNEYAYIGIGGYYNNNYGFDSNSTIFTWKRHREFFDVVSYIGNGAAGYSVNHNLGIAPEMMWVKNRTASANWLVYHKDMGAAKYGVLSGTGQFDAAQAAWNNTAPTDSQFTLGTYSNVNSSSNNYMAYLFATLAGVSKVGSYVATGNETNIDCGFSNGARFVLIKRADNAGNWYVLNVADGILTTNLSSLDPLIDLNTASAIDTQYNNMAPYPAGFTLTAYGASSPALNIAGATYIFYAIA